MKPYREGVPARIRGLPLWLHEHQTVRHGLVALFILAVGIPQLLLQKIYVEYGYRDPDAVQLIVTVLLTVSLTFRHRLPMSVLIGYLVGGTLLEALRYQPSFALVVGFLIAVYSVAAHRALAYSAIGFLIAFVAYLTLLISIDDNGGPVGVATNMALLVGVWWLGRSLRLRRAYLAELEDRAARLERARGTDARAARVEERSRIARELHDVVAHHVSVMTVQAGAARRILDKDPAGAKEAMTTIEEVGRAALSEMRRIVGVLHTERELSARARELAPQPGIDDLGSLIDHVRETGLAVRSQTGGERRPLPPGVDLAAYRLIQEALTNTLKHAGPRARAWVKIEYAPRELLVEVADDGRGVVAGLGSDDQPGHGLVGMYERVALYGGELRIGPRVGGGFQVRARFPLEA